MTRGIDSRFLTEMRRKLDEGRKKGYDGWDTHWDTCGPEVSGVGGWMVNRLLQEVAELIVAVSNDDGPAIASEAADVANFSMMIADVHGALNVNKRLGHHSHRPAQSE